MKRSTARTLAQMLRQVVEQGSATPADRDGLPIACKTATVSSAVRGSDRKDLWFVGFAPADVNAPWLTRGRT